MGTRNLTMVVSDNQTRIAQYGQWDGYPEGQGITILSFLRKVDIDDLKEKLKNERLRFFTEEDIKEYDDFSKSIGISDGWMNPEQSKLINEKYPFTTRDHGGEIIEKVYNELCNTSTTPILLGDSTEFSYNYSCEWAYVVDLDKEVLEVYEGYNSKPVEKEERFYKEGKKPVKFICSFSIRNIPATDDDFIETIKVLTKTDEDDEE